MLKKIGLVLLISLIQILLFWLFLFLTNTYFPITKIDISWGLTIYYSFITFSISIFLINLFSLFIENKILKFAIWILIIIIVNYIPISSFEYRPIRSLLLMLFINSNIFASYYLLKNMLLLSH